MLSHDTQGKVPAMSSRRGIVLVILLGLPTAALAINDATEAAASRQEEEANRAMWSIKGQDSPENVEGKVAEFLDAYPGSRRRREVRSRLVESYVLAGRTADTVDECMRQAFDFYGNYLGDMTLRDGWVRMASLFEERARWDVAARIRTRVYVNLPYQLENRRQLSLAVANLARAGLHAEVLRVGRLALAVLPEAESAEVFRAVVESLTQLQGEDAAQAFERFWLHGPAGEDGAVGTADDVSDPLADVAAAERDRLRDVAGKVLAAKGLIGGTPAEVSMQKGMLHVFAGDRPRAAIELQDAVLQSSPDQKGAAADLAGVFFRWVDGTSVRAVQYRRFVQIGRAGPDGAVGTADDLTNPFAEHEGGQVGR